MGSTHGGGFSPLAGWLNGVGVGVMDWLNDTNQVGISGQIGLVLPGHHTSWRLQLLLESHLTRPTMA